MFAILRMLIVEMSEKWLYKHAPKDASRFFTDYVQTPCLPTNSLVKYLLRSEKLE